MKLVELSTYEFSEYVKNSKYSSFYQSLEYLRFFQENDYQCDLMGLKDNYDNIRAASLIAFKKLDNKYSYGYSPRGFLIDYKDSGLVNDFAKALNKYYKKKNVLFIKINPNIIISEYDKINNKYV